MNTVQDFKDAKLKDLQLHKEDDESNSYYLTAVYEYENYNGVYEVTFPKIKLNINQPTVYVEENNRSAYPSIKTYVDIGFGSLLYLSPTDGMTRKIRCIKTKKKKMTLSEIEKVLGHEIELVSDKGD